MEYSDTYYVRRVQNGDVAGFACLLERYSGRVHSLIFRLTRNREDAEELAQDVFMKAFRGLDGFKGDSSFATWIYRIAYNAAISETRRRRVEFTAFDEALIESFPEESMTDLTGEEGASLTALDAALARLQDVEQAIVLFFYMEDKSIEEISEITKLSVANVKVKLHRARKKLYILLTQKEEEI
ncbi:MAG: sigma-70 family RNA polymerase sigma factor [Tannerellaceae bacterium]|jgi:RNA polymerase sigma-70 factor (ECF subfamily)|nr:sigma-70 family RNA polymerase sigma factor [Tannerellaceae bacterium]